jgi:hypothetical protein
MTLEATPLTWADVERAARECPVLQAAVTLVARGAYSQMEALIIVALWFAEYRHRFLAHEVERLMGLPFAAPARDVDERTH